MSIIIGINSFHGDSSACILKDGNLIAAVEEERFRRIKHWAGFPDLSIKYCLSAANCTLDQVDHIAINQNPTSNLIKKILHSIKTKPSLDLISDKLFKRVKKLSVKNLLLKSNLLGFQGKVHWIDHHLAHLASSYYVSGMEKALSVSVDGFGDFASTSWGIGEANTLSIDDQIYFPHSLGIFYQALTQYLGFPNYGDEFKVMGLAPYGTPKFLNLLGDVVNIHPDGKFSLNLNYFRHQNHKIISSLDHGEPSFDNIFTNNLLDLLGPPRAKGETISQHHMDLASSVQAMYEKAFLTLINCLHSKYKINNLCLSGGCAMNSVANGKIFRSTPFKEVYIQSAAGDAGGAIGAAFVVSKKFENVPNKFIMHHSYWGPKFDEPTIEKILAAKKDLLLNENASFYFEEDWNEVFIKTATAISQGKVVGWFQNEMEWGPRALGNRSILGDPRRSNMKDILNQKIKRRESFRPFAPSILSEDVGYWFEESADVPFMMQVFQIRKSKRDQIPAVTHVDGSGRLQTVSKNTNPIYYDLITQFKKITGIPLLLNTSFNENEPVVCTPNEALDCFLRTKMDLLVMGRWIISRRSLF